MYPCALVSELGPPLVALLNSLRAPYGTNHSIRVQNVDFQCIFCEGRWWIKREA